MGRPFGTLYRPMDQPTRFSVALYVPYHLSICIYITVGVRFAIRKKGRRPILRGSSPTQYICSVFGHAPVLPIQELQDRCRDTYRSVVSIVLFDRWVFCHSSIGHSP